MLPPNACLLFRRFRLFTLSISAVISLTWTFIVVVFLAKNWKGYEGREKGFLGGYAALDFVSSILLYLMIVVKYDYWWDAARAVALVGLHTTASVIFTKSGLYWPCDGFGSFAYCHGMSTAVLAGAWMLTALLMVYGSSLPIIRFAPRPEERTDDFTEESGNIRQEESRTHALSASRDLFLSSELPPSLDARFGGRRVSSISTSMAHRQLNNSRSVGSPTDSGSLYSTTLEGGSANAGPNPLAMRYSHLRTTTTRTPTPPFLRPGGTLLQEERPLSLISGAADGPSASASHEFPIYPGSSQTSVARPGAPSRTHSLSGLIVHPRPLFAGSPKEPEAYFDEIMFPNEPQSNPAGRYSVSMAEEYHLPLPAPTALIHSRSDSSGSNVDINQWRKLVTDAATGTR